MTGKTKWTSGERSTPESDPDWDRKLIRELATASLKEQRRSRRWGIFFRILGFAYLTVLLVSAFGHEWFDSEMTSGEHTAVVDLFGVIAADQPANAEAVTQGLRDAFKDAGTRAVLLRIDSPGGSPVQSGVIYDEMMRLRGEYPQIPLYAVIEDTCASGGYYVASAAERIFADKASLVGSIGVRMDSFGFVGAMEKLGIERRLLTAGENKALLDPFSPTNESQTQHIESMLVNIHEQFIEAVKHGRGDRIQDIPGLYSGLVWSGEQALEFGLVDALASDQSIARDIVEAETLVNFTPQEDLFNRLAGRLGAAISAGLSRVLLQQSLVQ